MAGRARGGRVRQTREIKVEDQDGVDEVGGEMVKTRVMFETPEGADRVVPLPVSTGADMVEALDAYQELQEALDAKMPEAIVEVHGRKFRKKVYWRTISRAFGLSVGEVSGSEELIRTGADDWGYKVTYRATNQSGDYTDGDGACMASEKFGDGATVHNVRSHAHTRAFNRATSNLVGFGEVSADELVSSDGPSAGVRAVGVPTVGGAQRTRSQGQPRGQKAQPQGTPPDGAPFTVESKIAEVFTKTGSNHKGPWEMHIVKLESGESGSTFTEEIGQHAMSCWEREMRVSATFIRKGNYTNLIVLDEILDTGELQSDVDKAEGQPLDLKDIPF